MISENMYAPLNDGPTATHDTNSPQAGQFEPMVPAPRAPTQEELCHPKLGIPTAVYEYFNARGETEGRVCRWDFERDGKPEKDIRPFRYGTYKGRTGFVWKGWKDDDERPLYRLPELVKSSSDAGVLIVEGEKTANRAAELFPAYAVVTVMNGSQSPHLTDMSPLLDRQVIIFPDHDTAGIEFAHAVAELALKAGAKSVRIVKVPADFPSKWDLADTIPAGSDMKTLETLMLEAQTVRNVEADGPDMGIAMRVRRPPPTFPADVFGELESVIKLQAASTSSPNDYTAIATLVIAAAVIGNACSVSPWPQWIEPCGLWAALVGNPSSGKSPALSPLIGVVRTIEADDEPKFAEDHRRWETEVEAARQTRDLWEKLVKTAVKEGTDVPVCPAGAIEPPEPPRPRIVVSDTTPEAVANLLAGLPRGMLSFRDELSGWLGSFDRYTGAQAERAFWLESFGGRSYTVDRVKHALPIVIPRLLISVLGGIQPDKLTDLLLSGDNDGLCARMLMAWPESKPPHRPTVFADPSIMLACLRRLRSLEMAFDGEAVRHPVVLSLTAEAADWFDQWRIRHYHVTHDVPGMLGGHFGKYPGLLLRLALVLEHLWWSATSATAAPSSISLTAVTAAGRLLDEYLRPMAECIYGDAAMPELERRETVLACWILKNKPKMINARDLHRKTRLPGLSDLRRSRRPWGHWWRPDG